MYPCEKTGDQRLAIAANQTVHDARALHITLRCLDGQQLIPCLLKRKHLLKFLLPDGILAKEEALFLLADRIELHQILRDLIDSRLHARFGLCPLLRAKFVQLRLFAASDEAYF